LQPGTTIVGPAIIAESLATTFVEPNWHCEVTSDNHLVLRRQKNPARAPQSQQEHMKADPVLLEVFNNLFMSIAEQMGLRLQQTAVSVNIKERLDFSCALFDRHGNLIANAPHMPVHLGSMGDSILTIVRKNAGRMRAGDVFCLNDPYNGGTHLPDITVVTPVFLSAQDDAPSFFVASRGCRRNHAGLHAALLAFGGR
jgi:5-oxoprolinase (ATP-hydrolysing)